jgi:predicted transcriptional regulator of viral defense system
VVAAWLGVSDPDAVISHGSGLELYDLSDAIPNAVHLSIPRAKRGQQATRRALPDHRRPPTPRATAQPCD